LYSSILLSHYHSYPPYTNFSRGRCLTHIGTEGCRLTDDPDRKLDLKLKIAELTRRITEAKRLWERYAPWDS
jgi:hypothetical protein